MKSSEIHKGKDYVYEFYMSRRHPASSVGTDRAWRGRALSAPVNGQVQIKVYYPGDKRSSRVETINVRNLVADWETHEARLAENTDQRTQDIREIKEAAATIKRLVSPKVYKEHLKYLHGIDGRVYNDGSYTTKVEKIDIRVLAEVLEDVRKHA